MANKRIQDEFDGLPTAQARYMARNRAKGVCVACAKPRSEHSSCFCLNCSKKHADRCRKYYAKSIGKVITPEDKPDVQF